MSYSVVLIGLGSIGMGYDFSLPVHSHVYTHARAFSSHPGFALLGASDPDGEACKKFTAQYGLSAFIDVEALLEPQGADVVVIASPTRTHLENIRKTLALSKPRLILCEKPLAYEAEEALEIVRLCEEAGIALYVNYFRRADPALLEVKARLEDGRIAKPAKAIVWYSKGLMHNGSHFIDLLSFWLGQARGWQIISSGADRGADDAEPDLQIVFEGGAAIFCAAREEDFSHYTVELLAPNGRLRYEESGKVLWQEAAAHPQLENYRRLASQPEDIPHDLNRYQYNVAEEVKKALDGAANSLCSGASGAAHVSLIRSILHTRLNKQD